MTKRHGLVAALAIIAGLSCAPFAFAAGTSPFNQAAFTAAQDAGKPILVQVTASWCPTCKSQERILSRLESGPRFGQLVSFNIDFDSQKSLLRKFGVSMQSTLIVFKGKQETGRSTGVTNPASIEALLRKAL